MSEPRVSVIVPTRDRAKSLRKLISSLEAQTLSSFELIVIDDGSREPIHASTAGMDDARLRFVRTEGVGAVEARCAGVKAATGEILAFTDDDCTVSPEWLGCGVAGIDGGADVVQGRTVPERDPLPLERTLAHSEDDGLFPTCNVFYRRTAYERAGGFDRNARARLGFRYGKRARSLGFGEDTMLGWAVARAGRAGTAPAAIVRHEVTRPPIGDLISRAWMAGAFPMLVRQVPELKRTLVRNGMILGRPDARLSVYGLGFLLIGPLQIFGVLSVVWWVLARTRRSLHRPGPLFDRATSIPVELALDVTTSLALLVGSARARTPIF